MSGHRNAVVALAEALGKTAKSFLSDDVTRQLVDEQVSETSVRPFADHSLSAALTNLKNETERMIREAEVEDFRKAEILIRLQPRERTGRCVSQRGMSSRRFNVVDVQVISAVETRWVHPRHEVEFARQWVIA